MGSGTGLLLWRIFVCAALIVTLWPKGGAAQVNRTVEMLVTYRIRRLWLAKLIVRACQVARPFVGMDRAVRWAMSARRVLGIKIIKQEWAK